MIPALSVDTDSAEGEVTVPYYGSSPVGSPGRFNPLLLVLPLDGGDIDPIHLTHGRVRGAPSTPVLAPDGRVVVPLPSADAVVTVDVDARIEGALGLFDAPIEAETSLARPTSVSFDRNGDPWVFEADTRSATRFQGDRPTLSLTTTNQDLGQELELGRRLFQTAAESSLSTPGSGVACATCHIDGGTDNNVWPLDGGDRQTPALVSAVAPYTWTLQVDSIADEIHLTSVERMGGSGLTDEQADALAAWVDHLRPVDVPEQDADAVVRGEQVFSHAGCASCHPAPTYTNGMSYALFGLDAVDTPSLLGLDATAPYLHDGRAETLADVIDLSADAGMGSVRGLDDQERADLAAFLASLEEAD
ncbi:MAG: c-type cytochrome [Proteobacteria bacterium]|nr:c-type cytochrome [Pseudomonadota bacterium]